jgi:hypothetical protein
VKKKTAYNSYLQEIGGSVVKPAYRQAGEALFSVSSFVLADSFRLRNRQLRVAANRYAPPEIESVLKLRDGIT